MDFTSVMISFFFGCLVCCCSLMYYRLCSPQHGVSSGCGWRDGLQLSRLAANILNKQSQRDNKGWPSSLGVRAWG
jgi:hypothetical protein